MNREHWKNREHREEEKRKCSVVSQISEPTICENRVEQRKENRNKESKISERKKKNRIRAFCCAIHLGVADGAVVGAGVRGVRGDSPSCARRVLSALATAGAFCRGDVCSAVALLPVCGRGTGVVARLDALSAMASGTVSVELALSGR